MFASDLPVILNESGKHELLPSSYDMVLFRRNEPRPCAARPTEDAQASLPALEVPTVFHKVLLEQRKVAPSLFFSDSLIGL